MWPVLQSHVIGPMSSSIPVGLVLRLVLLYMMMTSSSRFAHVAFAHAEDVFASSAHLRVLAESELALVQDLKRYIAEEHARLRIIDSLMQDVRAIHASESNKGDPKALVANPLHAFHLIKRFATTWRYIWQHASNFTAYDVLKSSVDGLSDFLPADSDLTSAMWSIVRLQKTYDLSIPDLVRGHVAGYQAPPLGQTMAFDLAILCLGNGEPDDAIRWLTYVQNAAFGLEYDDITGPTVPLPAVYQALARAYAQKQDYSTSLNYIQKAIELDPTNGGYLVDILPPAHLQLIVYGEPEWRRNYFRLCQKSAYSADNKQAFTTAPNGDCGSDHSSQTEETTSSLDCRLQTSRFSPFRRHRVEFLHRSPDVALFHDFISDRESEILRDLAVHRISRAKIGSTMDSQVSEARVGKIAWFYDDVDDAIVRKLSRRISDVTGLNMTFPTAEPLQMSNYGMGGHYEPHYDHDEHRFDRDDVSPEVAENGDRIATFMIYLNDVSVGGATVFPKMNLGTKPVKNAAIFWYNYKSSGEMDPLSLHAACPVLIGEKWVANKWIREYGQEFIRPCDLNEDAQSRHIVDSSASFSAIPTRLSFDR